MLLMLYGWITPGLNSQLVNSSPDSWSSTSYPWCSTLQTTNHLIARSLSWDPRGGLNPVRPFPKRTNHTGLPISHYNKIKFCLILLLYSKDSKAGLNFSKLEEWKMLLLINIFQEGRGVFPLPIYIFTTSGCAQII